MVALSHYYTLFQTTQESVKLTEVFDNIEEMNLLPV